MKKRLISILLAVVMVLSMLPTAFAEEAAEATPLSVSNGGFEEDLTGNWEVSSELEMGNNCLELNPSTGNKRVDQNITLIPGETYIFTAQVQTSASVSDYGVDIWTDSGRVTMIPSGYPFVSTASPEWSTYTKVFVANAQANHSFQLKALKRGDNAPWSIRYDDVTLHVYDPETQTTSGNNLITNGDFQGTVSNNVPEGWAGFWFDAATDGIVTVSNSYVHMTAPSEKRLNQAVTVEPGKTYIFSANVKTSDRIGEYGADIYEGNARVETIPSGYPFTNAVYSDWTQYTKVFKTGAATTSCSIQLKARGGSEGWDLYWDDCALYEYDTETQTTSGSNLLVNGSFDNGTTGWDPFWFDDCSVVTEGISGGGVDYYRDNQYWRLNPTAANQYLKLSQAVVLEGNSYYRLSIDLKNSGPAELGFRVNNGMTGSDIASQGYPFTNVSYSDWSKFSKDILTDDYSGTYFVQFGIRYNVSDSYWDNFEIYKLDGEGGNIVGENLVKNGDFEGEIGSMGWPVHYLPPFSSTNATSGIWGEGMVYEGRGAVQTVGLNETDDVYYEQTITEGLIEGAVQPFSAWVYKTTAETAPYMQATYYDAANQVVGDFADACSCDANGWYHVGVDTVVPTGAAKVVLKIGAKGVGDCYWDNVSTEPKPAIDSFDPAVEHEPLPGAVNMLYNGSFELVGEDGYPTQLDENGNPYTMTTYGGAWDQYASIISDGTAAEGNNYVKITAGGNPWVRFEVFGLEPGATYQLKIRYKGNSEKLGAKFEFYGDRNSDVYAFSSAVEPPNYGPSVGDDWNTFVYSAEVPYKADVLWLYVRNYGTGDAVLCADDVELIKVRDPKTADPFARIDTDRIFYYNEADPSLNVNTGTASVTLHSYYSVDGTSVSFRLLDENGNVLQTSGAVPFAEDRTAVWSYDISAMGVGDKYVVEATGSIAGLEEPFVATQNIYRYDRPSTISHEGVILNSDGTPFNAAIVYHGDEADFPIYNDGAITVVQGKICYSGEQVVHYLDNLPEGIKAAMPLYAYTSPLRPAGYPSNQEMVKEMVEAAKDHPNLFGWLVMDEPFVAVSSDDDSVNEMLGWMEDSYTLIHDIDTTHPVVSVIAYDYRYDLGAKYVDIMIIDRYPSKWHDWHTFVAAGAKYAATAVEDNKPILNLVQSCTVGGFNPPDGMVRHELYQAYLNDNNYVGYYPWIGDGVDTKVTDLNVWNELKHFKTYEADLFHEYFAQGFGTTFSKYDDSEVQYEAWFDPTGEIFYVALTNKDAEAKTVQIPLADDNGEFSGEAFVRAGNDTTIAGKDAQVSAVAGLMTVELKGSDAILIEMPVVYGSGGGADDTPELAIVTQPVSYEGIVGDTVEFAVEATGEALSYQWFYKIPGSEQWLKSYSDGATTETLSVELRAYRDGQEYRCVVTDANGETVVSDAVAMTLKAGEFTITEHPVDFVGAEGDTAIFAVKAEGDNLSYRWQYSNDGGQTWQNSWNDGYATDTLTVQLLAYRNGQQYRCVVSNPKGEQIISDAAVLSRKACEIKIVAQPESAIVAAGETVTFTVEATGESLKYRWYRSNDGGETWVETWLSGYNTNELSFVVNAARAATPYKCVITSGGTTVETEPVSVTIG